MFRNLVRALATTCACLLVCAAPSASALPPPDGLKLQSLLQSGKFDELDAELAVYQEAYRGGAISERDAAQGIRALRSRDPELRRAYDKWVAGKPGSYAARVARARYLVNLGYLARGGELASKTTKAQFDSMRAYFSSAREDLEVAQKLDPKPALTYTSLITIAQGLGERDEADRALAAAIALDPRVFWARTAYLSMLRPEWGGSLARMETAFAEWRPSLGEEEAKALGGTLENQRWAVPLYPARVLVDNKNQYREAIALYDQTLVKEPVVSAYVMRGYCYAQLGEHRKAVEDFNRALELDPESSCCPGTRSNRAASYLKLGALDKAMPDLMAAALDDDNAWATRELAMMYAFGQHGFKTDYGAARRWCERAAKQGDGLAMYCMGSIYHAALGVPKDLPLAAAACDPPRAEFARAATTLDAKPAIAWMPVKGATSYRVRIQSRVPNGRVLAQHDAVVSEPRFFPPQPLADYRAKVTVRLIAICGKEKSAEAVSWFIIDASAACSGQGRVENRTHALTDGSLITAKESRTTPHVQSTRPLCAGARGEATYRVVTGD